MLSMPIEVVSKTQPSRHNELFLSTRPVKVGAARPDGAGAGGSRVFLLIA